MNQSPGEGLLPRSLVEILQYAVVLYTRNLWSFLGTAAIILIPLTIVQLVLSGTFLDGIGSNVTTTNASGEANVDLTLLVLMLLILFQAVLLNGVLTFMASESLLGRRVTPFQALENMGNRLIPLAIALIMVGIGLGMSFFILALFYFLCGLGLGIILYFIINLFTLLVPVMVLERIGVFDGILRTWGLSKRRFWPIAGLLLVILVILFLTTFVTTIFGGLFTPNGGDGINIVVVFLELAVGIVLAPIMPIASTLMYYDTRLRVEGLDLALESVDKPDPRPSDIPSPYIPLSFRRNDLKDMVLVSIIGVILLFVIGVIVLTFADPAWMEQFQY